jgi:hypothetical protein
MTWLRVVAMTLALGLLPPALAFQAKDSEKKDDKKVVKGILPANFKKLGLTDKQKQEVYRLQAEYKEKADELKRKLELLKKEEREKIEGVLTAEQMKRLKELRAGEK